MDGNKDAARKCIEIGNQALKDGDKPRAHRFLSKAQRLDPTLSLHELISSLENGTCEQQQSVNSSSAEDEPPIVHETSNVNGKPRSQNGNDAPKAAPEYTSEQVDIVRRIRKMKDYYEILGVAKDCSVEEIRKAYRKVSLKVHPDKNKAPGAEEAFKSVSRAFACLSEPELRKNYDQFGPEEANDVAQRQSASFRRRHRNGFVYDDMFDLDPNEIFNAFFNGTPYTAQGFRRAHHVRTGPYEFRHETKLNKVPFYVRSQDFDREYPSESPSRRNLEIQIEREHVNVLQYYCRQERSWKQWHPTMKTPNCDMLRSFKVY